jgi:hypothetical protein
MLGKLFVPADFSKKLATQGLALLSITAEHAEAIRDFPELASITTEATATDYPDRGATRKHTGPQPARLSPVAGTDERAD